VYDLKSEEKEEDTEPEIKRSDEADVKPLNREEWVETLRLEHTKLIINYELIIANALKAKYNQLFGKSPDSYEDMVEKLGTKMNIPYNAEIRNIRLLRNEFLKSHKPITMEDLKRSYETTILFLREFL